MKRLRDTRASSPLLKNVQALLEAAPPLSDSRDRMLRVRSALDQRRARAGLLRVPALAAAAAIALFGASAFAAVRIYEAIEQPAAAPQPQSAAGHAARSVRRAARRDVAQPVPAPVASPAEVAPAADPAAQPAHEIPARERTAPRPATGRAHASTPNGEASGDTAPALGGGASSRGASRRRAHAEAARPHAEPEPAAEPEAASDSELVHRAVKALRRDGDPALAARLLQEHRARSPRGPLAEEALSLQIEAALALRSPRAVALAREYLARHPDGRYAHVAARALQEAPP